MADFSDRIIKLTRMLDSEGRLPYADTDTKYHLELNGSVLTLVGSDGTRDSETLPTGGGSGSYRIYQNGDQIYLRQDSDTDLIIQGSASIGINSQKEITINAAGVSRTQIDSNGSSLPMGNVGQVLTRDTNGNGFAWTDATDSDTTYTFSQFRNTLSIRDNISGTVFHYTPTGVDSDSESGVIMRDSEGGTVGTLLYVTDSDTNLVYLQSGNYEPAHNGRPSIPQHDVVYQHGNTFNAKKIWGQSASPLPRIVPHDGNNTPPANAWYIQVGPDFTDAYLNFLKFNNANRPFYFTIREEQVSNQAPVRWFGAEVAISGVELWYGADSEFHDNGERYLTFAQDTDIVTWDAPNPILVDGLTTGQPPQTFYWDESADSANTVRALILYERIPTVPAVPATPQVGLRLPVTKPDYMFVDTDDFIAGANIVITDSDGKVRISSTASGGSVDTDDFIAGTGITITQVGDRVRIDSTGGGVGDSERVFGNGGTDFGLRAPFVIDTDSDLVRLQTTNYSPAVAEVIHESFLSISGGFIYGQASSQALALLPNALDGNVVIDFGSRETAVEATHNDSDYYRIEFTNASTGAVEYRAEMRGGDMTLGATYYTIAPGNITWSVATLDSDGTLTTPVRGMRAYRYTPAVAQVGERVWLPTTEHNGGPDSEFEAIQRELQEIREYRDHHVLGIPSDQTTGVQAPLQFDSIGVNSSSIVITVPDSDFSTWDTYFTLLNTNRSTDNTAAFNFSVNKWEDSERRFINNSYAMIWGSFSKDTDNYTFTFSGQQVYVNNVQITSATLTTDQRNGYYTAWRVYANNQHIGSYPDVQGRGDSDATYYTIPNRSVLLFENDDRDLNWRSIESLVQEFSVDSEWVDEELQRLGLDYDSEEGRLTLEVHYRETRPAYPGQTEIWSGEISRIEQGSNIQLGTFGQFTLTWDNLGSASPSLHSRSVEVQSSAYGGGFAFLGLAVANALTADFDSNPGSYPDLANVYTNGSGTLYLEYSVPGIPNRADYSVGFDGRLTGSGGSVIANTGVAEIIYNSEPGGIGRLVREGRDSEAAQYSIQNAGSVVLPVWGDEITQLQEHVSANLKELREHIGGIEIDISQNVKEFDLISYSRTGISIRGATAVNFWEQISEIMRVEGFEAGDGSGHATLSFTAQSYNATTRRFEPTQINVEYFPLQDIRDTDSGRSVSFDTDTNTLAINFRYRTTAQDGYHTGTVKVNGHDIISASVQNLERGYFSNFFIYDNYGGVALSLTDSELESVGVDTEYNPVAANEYWRTAENSDGTNRMELRNFVTDVNALIAAHPSTGGSDSDVRLRDATLYPRIRDAIYYRPVYSATDSDLLQNAEVRIDDIDSDSGTINLAAIYTYGTYDSESLLTNIDYYEGNIPVTYGRIPTFANIVELNNRTLDLDVGDLIILGTSVQRIANFARVGANAAYVAVTRTLGVQFFRDSATGDFLRKEVT